MKNSFAGAVVVFAAVSLLVGCGVSEAPDVEVVGARWATANASSVPALVGSSDAVFTGRVTRELPQREETLPGPEGRPSSGRTFPISRYEVAVEGVVTGDVPPGTLVIEQAGGEGPGDGHIIVLEGDEPIDVGKTYVFFATQKVNGTWTAAPFGRFEVGGDGRLKAPEQWSELGAAQALDGTPASEAEGEIGSAAHE